MVDFECVRYNIQQIKFKFSRAKVCVEMGYGPNEVEGKERERFWNDLDSIVDRVGNGYILCFFRDLNGWINWSICSFKRKW